MNVYNEKVFYVNFHMENVLYSSTRYYCVTKESSLYIVDYTVKQKQG